MRAGQKSQSSKLKKQKLIELARSDKEKPKSDTVLGNALRNYSNSKSAAYDSEFIEQIKQYRPEWFIDKRQKAKCVKEILLTRAKQKNSKQPTGKTLTKLRLFTDPKSKYFDSEFRSQIQNFKPLWLFSKSEIHKQALIKMAKEGKPRPKQRDKDPTLQELGKRFCYYVCSTNAEYDPHFVKKIKEINEKWLLTRFEKVKKNKEKLIQMAIFGKPRPKQSCYLGRCYNNYVSPNSGSYDCEFAKSIKKINPKF